MYKRLVFGVIALASFIFIAIPVHAGVQDFTITSFVADYYVSRDEARVSHMSVREKIVAEFPNFDQNHGILRAIPQSYDGHGLELDIASVKKPNGEQWQYETSDENGNTVLKIGDPDAYVQGPQTYILEYTVRGPVTFEGAERLFWDVNGDQWPQSFGEVVARVHLPSDLAQSIGNQPSCLTGSFGSEKSACRVSTEDDGKGKIITFETARPLNGYETLTFSVPFTAGTFAPYTMSAEAVWHAVLLGVVIAVPPLVVLWFVVRHWRKYGRDAKGRGVVVPQYLPPKGVSVLGSSALWHQGFQPTAISATIIDLAVRHYIKIYETGKTLFGGYEYDVELTKAPTDLLPEEQQVVKLLFTSTAAGTRVSLKDLNKKLYEEATKIGESVDEYMAAQKYFVQKPSQARAPFIIAGIIMVICGFVFMPYTLGLVISGIITLIGGAVMAAPTHKGAELKEYLEGLKKYMKLAEAERIRVLQSPDGRLTEKVDVADKGQLVKLYERLLPYAVLFGIEKKWAKEFAGLYDRPPEWYSGTGTFNAAYFAGALTSLDTTMTQSFSPPSSSGGGAGGGGGGGGGGGW
jgi:uncharacterized membrane protein YgcG